MTNPTEKTNGIARSNGHAADHPHANSIRGDVEYGAEVEGDLEYPKKSKSSVTSDMVFVMAATALFAAMISTPSCIWVVRHWNDPKAPVAQGTVQRILYVGNLGIDTQIDTEQRSLIVQGITKLRVGARVETRKGTWAHLLCDQDSGLCEDLVHAE